MSQGRGAWKRLGLALVSMTMVFSGCATTGKPAAARPSWAVIEADADFAAALEAALHRLQQAKAGRELLSRIENSGKTVRFRRNKLNTGLCSGLDDKPIVWWNPSFGVPETPPELGLHHELVHALQRQELRIDEPNWMEDEAIGIGDFKAAPYSENALRREWELPPRTTHDELPGMSEDYLIEKTSPGKLQPDWEWNDPTGGWRPKKIEVKIPEWVEEIE